VKKLQLKLQIGETVLSILLMAIVFQARAQLPVYPDSIFSTYYHQRWTLFKSLPQTKDDIIFLGNSITDGGEWNELFKDIHIKNRGISGDISAGVIKRIDEVTNRKPAKVFLMIGVNDLARGISPDSVVKNILLIAVYLRQLTPKTKLYVQSILPVNDIYKMFAGHTSKMDQIKQVNEQLMLKATEYKYTFINLHSSFCNIQKKLLPEFTNDGLHLKGEGYLLWKHILFPYIYDLQKEPSLLPMPQQVEWNEGYFRLYDCKDIIIKNDSLNKEAGLLQQYLSEKGWEVQLRNNKSGRDLAIELRIDKDPSTPQIEAYKLRVNAKEVLISANSLHGIFNGIQTLKQLMRDGVMIDACNIIDSPAFSWRGYMIDVGRNFVSMDLLKQQIDMMATYKMNVFHFHATEDIAWRIAIRQYPELTAPENMLRNKGQYYTEKEMKELITYCKERFITLVPEIDMPGHSAAFRRAMGFDMQSDSGIVVLKNIIKEFIETYDLPYFHIGADEVKITNRNFVPEITSYIQSFGKKVIGWQPGGNFSNNTIRQMWMDDNGKIASNGNIEYIDSRHLYLNHMDPLEAVVTIFNRRIADKEKGDANALGAELCLWHDRAVGKEEDLLQMNPVYPGILAFSERVWKGGGNSGWTAVIGEPSSKEATEFASFEQRLIDHRKQFLQKLPFPYTEQSSKVWKLFGPYKNKGDLSAKFLPEQKGFDAERTVAAKIVVGGTVVLRHWWYPLIKGVIDQPEDSCTWYAYTKFWSEEDAIKNFWIGFNNLSRSPATDSPPKDAWDYKQGDIWVNGKIVNPPHWKRGGEKGNPEIPLVDEGFEYRTPTTVQLKKGWNTVLIKLPVGSFRGKDWQNPVKWMFTFVEVDDRWEQ